MLAEAYQTQHFGRSIALEHRAMTVAALRARVTELEDAMAEITPQIVADAVAAERAKWDRLGDSLYNAGYKAGWNAAIRATSAAGEG